MLFHVALVLLLFNRERKAQTENQKREFALFQPGNHLLEFIMRKLARVFFEDGLRCLGRWRVKKNDCGDVLTERLRNAGELLRQHPHTDAGVACREAEFHQLSGPTFHVFRGGAVIENDESVRAFESKTGQLKPCFDMVLLADDYIQPRVSLTKPVQRSVVGDGRADQHNVIKLASEWAVELVHEKLSLARVGRANNQRVEWNISGVHFNTLQNAAVYLKC